MMIKLCVFLLDPVDVLRVLQLPTLPEGVQKVPGFCTSRRAGTPDHAYRITKKAQISAPTKQLFSGATLQLQYLIMLIADKAKALSVLCFFFYMYAVVMLRKITGLHENHLGLKYAITPPKQDKRFSAANEMVSLDVNLGLIMEAVVLWASFQQVAS